MSKLSLLSFLLILHLPIAMAQNPVIDEVHQGLAEGPYSSMRMLYERTLFKVNVMDLRVTVDAGTQAELRDIAEGRPYSEKAEEEVAQVMLTAVNALVEGRFVRDATYREFILEARKSVRCAEKEDIIDETEKERVLKGLPYWFAPLSKRGIKPGDRLIYRAEGNTLRTLFVAGDGTILVNRLELGPQPIETMLASYFAECSSFREKLIRSLF